MQRIDRFVRPKGESFEPDQIHLPHVHTLTGKIISIDTIQKCLNIPIKTTIWKKK